MEKQDCLHQHHRHHQHTGPKESLLSSTETFLVSSKFHQDNRSRLLTAFKAGIKEIGKNSIIFLKGKSEMFHHDDDINIDDAQESNFHYLFGVDDNDCYAWINVDNGEVTLFAPKYPANYRTWMKFDEPATMKTKYNVHAVYYVDDIESKLKELSPATIYLYDGTNSDSGLKPAIPAFEYLKNHKVDNTALYAILNECRVIKSPEEISIMRFVNQLCSDAHVRVLRNMRPALKEYQIESLFRFHVMERAGCRHLAYGCICASGEDAATLHYIVNDKELKDGAMMLNDMGSRYYGYCADITVTVPVNGKFTKHQAEIYNSVLKAQLAVIAAAKPGVRWDDMHLLAEKSMLADLIELGIVNKVPIEELVEARAGALFFPHGLGHLIGLNTHDVGGYNPGCPERSTQLGLKSLRTRRELKEGMCITVEPGLYFIEFAIEQAMKDPARAKFYNADKLNEYKHVGGIRIEDVCVITKTGMELLSDCPRTVAQIETCMAGKTWKDAK